MILIFCPGEEGTGKAANVLAPLLKPGDVLLLSGEMGAGKSVFTRALARSMGIEGPIPSPTFTILNLHDGPKGTLYHFDLYRLEDENELYEMGLDELIPPEDGIAAIEWPEQCEDAMPEVAFRLRFEYDPQELTGRILTIECPAGFDESLLIDKLNASGLNAGRLGI